MLALGCSKQGGGGSFRVPVTVARAEQRSVPYELLGTGTVEPRQTASVQAQVTGILTRVAFREGDDVAAGQLLFQIDPRPFQAMLEQAQGMLARDQAQARSALGDAERYAELVTQDYVTKSDYEAKRAAAGALQAAVRADSAAVANAQLNLEWAAIRAPIAGRTGRLLVREGNLVRSNAADPLVVINQIRPILVRFAVPQEHLGDIQRYRQHRLPVFASPSQSDTLFSEGVLTFVDNSVDTTTGTVLLKGEFSNLDNALWPGEFLNVRLQLYIEGKALVVPAPVMTPTVMRGSLMFGLTAYPLLPVSNLPNVDFPTIQVNASLPGASPETMASAVATQLEKQFSTIAGVDQMTSSSSLGSTNITLQFTLDRNIDAAAQDVQAAISKTLRQLPTSIVPPSYQKVNPADQPIIYYALSSGTLSLSELDEYAETFIAQRLSMVDGVAQVNVYGAAKYAVRIQLDPNALD